MIKIEGHILQQLESAYGLHISDVEVMRSGYNDVFQLVTDKGKKALKVSDKTREHVQFEQGFIKSLIEAGFTGVPVPVSIEKPDAVDEVIEDTIAIIEGRPYLLFEWIGGEEYGGGLEQITSAGENLAKFHEVSGQILEQRLTEGKTDYISIRSQWGDLVVRFPPQGNGQDVQGNDIWSEHIRQAYSPKQLRVPTVHYEWSLTDNSEVGKFVRDCAPFVERKLAQIKNGLYGMGFRCEETESGIMYHFPVPKVIVHADYAPQNLKFKENRVCAILDFDNANARERMYDVSWGLATFSAEGDGTLNHDKLTAFLRGYASVSPLRVAEAGIILYEIYTRCMETMYWPAEKYRKGQHWRLDFASHDFEIIKWLDSNESQIIDIIHKAIS
ncbi:MAG: phosphotransferase [Nanoarchaeota archaeon]|nr:phosphotransferase [Nanoarchaeota archaeon]